MADVIPLPQRRKTNAKKYQYIPPAEQVGINHSGPNIRPGLSTSKPFLLRLRGLPGHFQVTQDSLEGSHQVWLEFAHSSSSVMIHLKVVYILEGKGAG